MNSRIFLNLMAIPTIVGSLLTMVLFSTKASANEVIQPTQKANITNQVSCDLSQPSAFKTSMIDHTNKGILIASSGDVPLLDFSEAESDAAVTLFGCDCSSCLRGLRQLRAQPAVDLNKVNGHCWSSLQERVTPEQMKTVLQELKDKEAN
jgi:Fe-S cluster biogenesis protein NfuA